MKMQVEYQHFFLIKQKQRENLFHFQNWPIEFPNVQVCDATEAQ
jgi:hypothetical protein